MRDCIRRLHSAIAIARASMNHAGTLLMVMHAAARSRLDLCIPARIVLYESLVQYSYVSPGHPFETSIKTPSSYHSARSSRGGALLDQVMATAWLHTHIQCLDQRFRCAGLPHAMYVISGERSPNSEVPGNILKMCASRSGAGRGRVPSRGRLEWTGTLTYKAQGVRRGPGG